MMSRAQGVWSDRSLTVDSDVGTAGFIQVKLWMEMSVVLKSTTAGAEAVGGERNSLGNLLKHYAKEDLGLLREYEMMKERIEVERLADTGRECANGCGPVAREKKCPCCDKYARATAAQRRAR
jgi:hypothetical protein